MRLGILGLASEKAIEDVGRFHTNELGEEKMKARPLPEATQKRIIAAVRVVAVVVGAILLLLGILGMSGEVVIDRLSCIGLVVIGLLMMLSGILKAWLLDFFPW